jgi:mannose-6-phosphate isomerase-like protein (cupin superfamily)
MKILAGGCRVFAAGDGLRGADGLRRFRSTICRETGAREIAQAVTEYGRGRAPARVNPTAEQVLYIARGWGTCRVAGFEYAVEPGAGVYIPPGAPWSMENPSDEPLVVVSVCCPEEQAQEAEEPATPAGERPRLIVHEREREAIPSGDRRFKYMVDKDLGCRQITQFVGFIPPSKAPFHSHTYEEGIYILEGTGVVHTEAESTDFGPDTCIYLPPGTRHCLENPGEAAVRLLGVFYPSGSPAARYDEDQDG